MISASLNFILNLAHFFPKYSEDIGGGKIDLTFIRILESLP